MLKLLNKNIKHSLKIFMNNFIILLYIYIFQYNNYINKYKMKYLKKMENIR